MVASFPVRHGMQLMLVTDQAKLIRLPIDFRHLIPDGFENHKGWSIYGRGSSGVKVFDVAKGEQIVGAARIDEDADPENDAEAAIMDERMAREDQTTTPHTTLDRDDPPPTDV